MESCQELLKSIAFEFLSINTPQDCPAKVASFVQSKFEIMNPHAAQLNLVLAWLWIVVGFGIGFFFGLNFQKERWLGGYASFQRRLYRLAHISFFGLGGVNFLFYLTTQSFTHGSIAVTIASWGFVLGAVSMPLCCFVLAHQPRLRALFLIPVLSLITAGTLTLWEAANL